VGWGVGGVAGGGAGGRGSVVWGGGGAGGVDGQIRKEKKGKSTKHEKVSSATLKKNAAFVADAKHCQTSTKRDLKTLYGKREVKSRL